MKTGELWTPKAEDPCSLLVFRTGQQKNNSSPMEPGVVILKLTEYLGRDLWAYKNVGTVHYAIYDRETRSEQTSISGQNLVNHYVRIGEAREPGIERELRELKNELNKQIEKDY